MKIHPYLSFDGDCADAFRFYQQVLGGEVEMMTHADMPATEEVGPEWHGRVIHACLMAGDTVLMGADTPPGDYTRPAGVCVSVHPTDAAEGERIFHALAEGGTVVMPFEQTFWAERFGMVTDRFGTPWMVNVATCDSL